MAVIAAGLGVAHRGRCDPAALAFLWRDSHSCVVWFWTMLTVLARTMRWHVCFCGRRSSLSTAPGPDYTFEQNSVFGCCDVRARECIVLFTSSHAATRFRSTLRNTRLLLLSKVFSESALTPCGSAWSRFDDSLQAQCRPFSSSDYG